MLVSCGGLGRGLWTGTCDTGTPARLLTMTFWPSVLPSLVEQKGLLGIFQVIGTKLSSSPKLLKFLVTAAVCSNYFTSIFSM